MSYLCAAREIGSLHDLGARWKGPTFPGVTAVGVTSMSTIELIAAATRFVEWPRAQESSG